MSRRANGRLVAALLWAALASTGCKGRAPGPNPAASVDAAAVAAPAPVADAGAAAANEWREDQPPAVPANVPVATAPRGMVVSEGALATRVGVAVLEDGGNAVDAAVAVAFALAVVHPTAGNLGGGGFALVRERGGKVVALDFRETAPAAATPDMYASKGPGASLEGALSAGVPGSVAGLWALHKKYGKKKWASLVLPAIKLARGGFTVDEQLHRSITLAAPRLQKNAAAAALFLPGGAPPPVGSTWASPELADTLQRIAERGPAGFYEGPTAELVVAEMQRGGGIITKEDLAGYRSEWREPVRFPYRGTTVYSMPPPSSGGITLAMTALIVEGFDLRQMGWHSTLAVHVVAEAWRRAYAARNLYLGDPAFVKDMPLAKLTSKAHAEALRKTIDLERASSSEITPELLEGKHTTHFGVVDKDGMVVSLTTTINLGFGSGVVVQGAGFLLNNEMDDFATRPGQPNAYGLVQGEANKIEPGKRMLSSMSPTIVVDGDNQPVVIVGAQGGSRIITAVFQVLSNVVDFDMGVGQAVGAARFHHQHLPDEISLEPGAFTREVWDALRARGHKLAWTKWPIGSAPAIVRKDGQWTGAVDPRIGGLAMGY